MGSNKLAICLVAFFRICLHPIQLEIHLRIKEANSGNIHTLTLQIEFGWTQCLLDFPKCIQLILNLVKSYRNLKSQNLCLVTLNFIQ